MLTRYEHLRGATCHLAAPAEEQQAYLDDLLLPLAVEGDSSAYECDELALQFEDYFISVENMLGAGELSVEQVEALYALNDALEGLSGEKHADFWQRDALRSDPRSADVRALAQEAMKLLPPRIEREAANP